MAFKKHIPNTITCCNLLSGCAATLAALQHEFLWAFLLIVLGAVFDFFDGFAARLLKVSSPIGKELDSLADDITFGFAPAAVVFSLLQEIVDPANIHASCPLSGIAELEYIPYLAFLIAAFSALRLAKFNIDERQATSFIGLPTPANALFWSSLALSLVKEGIYAQTWLLYVIVPGIFLSCWILVAEIPMFALKFKNFQFRGNILRYVFILCSLPLLVAFRWLGFAVVILFYIMMSVVTNIIVTKFAEEE